MYRWKSKEDNTTDNTRWSIQFAKNNFTFTKKIVVVVFYLPTRIDTGNCGGCP